MSLPVRRTLLALDALFFAVLLLEVDLGHQPALAAHRLDLALLPVALVPVAIVALGWALLFPSARAGAALWTVMAVLAVVGVIGFFAHLQASGVGLATLSRLFLRGTWEGPACPNWPIAITLAAVFGAIGAPAGGAAAERQPLPFGTAGAAAIGVAFLLLVLSIPLVLIPASTGVGSAAVVAASLFLVAVVAGEALTATRSQEAP